MARGPASHRSTLAATGVRQASAAPPERDEADRGREQDAVYAPVHYLLRFSRRNRATSARSSSISLLCTWIAATAIDM